MLTDVMWWIVTSSCNETVQVAMAYENREDTPRGIMTLIDNDVTWCLELRFNLRDFKSKNFVKNYYF